MTINQRIRDANQIQFLIEHVEHMCERAGINPDESIRSDLSEWIIKEVRLRKNSE